MANPEGTNGFYKPEPKYGDVKRQRELGKAAPMVSTPAVNAPKTYQRRAVQGSQSAPKPQGGSGGTPMPYEQELALTWAEIAAQPGASELVKAIAMRAQRF